MGEKVNLGDQFAYSREEIDQMKRRAEIRKRLQREYYAYYRNPLLGAYRIDTYDPAQQRHTAALSFQPDRVAKYFKLRHYLAYFGLILGVPYVYNEITLRLTLGKDIEERIRTGELSLEDRWKNRFVPHF